MQNPHFQRDSALFCLLSVAGLFTTAAHAQSTDTDSFVVKLTITESCAFSTSTDATDVDFGTVPRSTDPSDATGNLVVDCTPGTPYTISLNNGLNPSSGAGAPATANNRRMSDGAGNYVPYGLWSDASRVNLWGTVDNSQGYAGTGTGDGQNIPVYGRVPAGATNVPGATYTDTVTATLTF